MHATINQNTFHYELNSKNELESYKDRLNINIDYEHCDKKSLYVEFKVISSDDINLSETAGDITTILVIDKSIVSGNCNEFPEKFIMIADINNRNYIEKTLIEKIESFEGESWDDIALQIVKFFNYEFEVFDKKDGNYHLYKNDEDWNIVYLN